MNDAFQPTLLVSMPQLQDPNFTRSVVLLCDYLPDGAFGLVLNRPTDLPASTMVKLEPAVADGNSLPLCIGGPVEPDRGWILLAEAANALKQASPGLAERYLGKGRFLKTLRAADLISERKSARGLEIRPRLVVVARKSVG